MLVVLPFCKYSTMPIKSNVFKKTDGQDLRCAVLGECMIELSGAVNQPMRQQFAGDTLNTATYLRRLAPENARIFYATALGEDAFSAAMQEQWQVEGMQCSYVACMPDKQPGIYYIEVDEQGERRFSYWRNESAARYYLNTAIGQQFLRELPQLDVLYLSGISLAILPPDDRQQLLKAIERMRAAGGKLVFDNNYRPRLWPNEGEAQASYRAILQQTDLALLTLDDERLLFHDISEVSVLQRCRSFEIPEVVIKRGARSCIIQLAQGQDQWSQSEVEATAVTSVVDTTAAGDSFSAAYLAARLFGLDVTIAAQWAHKLAATVIQYPGAIIEKESMPRFTA